MDARPNLDMFTMVVLRRRIEAIIREMINALFKSGRSGVLNTAMDFSCSLTDDRFQSVSVALGLPVHVGAIHLIPKAVVEKQFNMTVPDNVSIKAVEENANTIYVIVPHSVAAGAELADEDLEKVAGGSTVKGDANCGDSDGAMNTVVEINAEFSLL